jgi:CheY-like chemotaxis protein
VIAGTAAKLDALRIARSSEFDVALLDVNLGGERVDPVTEAIRARGIPIVFVTGYGKTAASGLVLAKPYAAPALEDMLNLTESHSLLAMAAVILLRLGNGIGWRPAAAGDVR